MGGDQLVPALVGEQVDREQGDAIRTARETSSNQLIDEVAPPDGSCQLLEDLKERSFGVVFASSSPQDEVEHYLDLLDARELVDAWTTDDDVEATKPQPDLVRAALGKAGADEAVMIGDTPWDVEAARRASIEIVTLITGGYCEQELREGGAATVYESVADVRRHLDEPPFV
jgi:HAD superfamily hydrolase (TIGR01509 family)